MNPWTTADYALIVSLCSAAISLLGVGWNVWSKFIFPRARLTVNVAHMTVIDPAGQDGDDNVISVTVINHGPTTVILKMFLLRKTKWFFWMRRNASLNPLHNYPIERRLSVGPFGGGLPYKLDVGEGFSAYFTPDHRAFAGLQFDQVGLVDGFGRTHWCRRSEFRETRRAVRSYMLKHDGDPG